MSRYRPNREPDVVLSCGCVALGWPIIRDMTAHEDILGCDTHTNGPCKWGTQKVLREATVYERVRFYEFGIPAAKRRSSKPPDWLRTMQGSSKQRATGGEP